MQLKPHKNSAFTYIFPKNQQACSTINDRSSYYQTNGGMRNKFLDLEEHYDKFLESIKLKKEQKTDNFEPNYEERNEQLKSVTINSIKNEPQIKKNKDRKPFYNDSKNIPKNFGKAIIAFIQKNPEVVSKCLLRYDYDYKQFVTLLKKRKRSLHSIRQLRSMWLDSEFALAKPFRQISLYFMNRGSLRYIFGSRIIDHKGHLKYRNRIISALSNPTNFHSIKHE